jgi:hypothetical protein
MTKKKQTPEREATRLEQVAIDQGDQLGRCWTFPSGLRDALGLQDKPQQMLAEDIRQFMLNEECASSRRRDQ